MKQTLVRTLAHMPFGNAIFRMWRSYREPVSLGQFKGAQDIFTHYFQENVWGDPESFSGPGSTLEYTENLRRELPRLLQQFGIARMLDAPCGDFNWFRRIPRPSGPDYVGGDIVQPLIQRNAERYTDSRTRFVHIDIRRDALPEADLWMCRDCLQHLSEQDIVEALDNFVRSGIRYILTSTHPECRQNTDGATGSQRLINLTLPPFDFGEPLATIDDWVAPFPRRYMGLWTRDQVLRGLESNRLWQKMARRRSGAS